MRVVTSTATGRVMRVVRLVAGVRVMGVVPERFHRRVGRRQGEQLRGWVRALDDDYLGATEACSGVDHFCLRSCWKESSKCDAERDEYRLLLHEMRNIDVPN
jgi:hypothetical protein